LRIVVDSYAWVELFIGSDKGRVVKKRLGEADEVCTPDIVLAELARKYRKENVDANIIAERLSRVAELSRIVPIDKSIAVKAAELDLELGRTAAGANYRAPSFSDAVVLAVAKALDANLITADEHFRDRPEVIWVGDKG
jgi:predicted nucleic acid-binding protein